VAEARPAEQRVGPTANSKPRVSRLDKWDGSAKVGEVRAKLKQSGEFAGGWKRFLDYLGLPLGMGLTKDTPVTQARRFAGEKDGEKCVEKMGTFSATSTATTLSGETRLLQALAEPQARVSPHRGRPLVQA
jgi:hypothetical protein